MISFDSFYSTSFEFYTSCCECVVLFLYFTMIWGGFRSASKDEFVTVAEGKHVVNSEGLEKGIVCIYLYIDYNVASVWAHDVMANQEDQVFKPKVPMLGLPSKPPAQRTEETCLSRF